MKSDVLDRITRLGTVPDLPTAVAATASSPTSEQTAFERNLVDFDNDPPWPGEWDNSSR